MDTWGISITAYETAASATISSACFDVLVGGATDDVLISSLLMGWSYGGTARTYFFPLHIPSGARVAVQHANETASRAASVVVALYGGTPPPFKVGSKVTTYGTQDEQLRSAAVRHPHRVRRGSVRYANDRVVHR